MDARLQRGAIYVGGFVGPFAGQALGVILPEFGHSFSITLSQASATLSAYLFPYAIMMLFSGRLVAGRSPSLVVTIAYVVSIAAALVLIITPFWQLFLAGFVVMGIANAFTTPVLQVILKRIVPDNELGSALGTYTAMQSLGIFSAPLIAGLSANFSWRLIYVLVFLAMAFILVARVPHLPAQPITRADDNSRVAITTTVAAFAVCGAIGVSVIGAPFLTALVVGDRFGLGPTGRGLVVMIGGLSAFLLSRHVGKMSDRVGPRLVLLTSLAVGAIALATLAVSHILALTVLCWALAVVCAQAAQTSINISVLTHPGGTSIISSVQAFRYFGSAAAPVVLLPIYNTAAGLGFLVPAALLLLAAGTQFAFGYRK